MNRPLDGAAPASGAAPSGRGGAATAPGAPGAPGSQEHHAHRLEDLLRRRRLHRQAVASSHPLRRPVRLGLTGFAAVVAAGTALLMLPVATVDGDGASLRTALFTATSAASVTGLTVVDTGSYWSGFGHVVLLVLIQLGGLGVMTFASLLSLLVSGRLGLRSRLLAGAEYRTLDLRTVRRVVLGVVRLSLVIETVLFVLLTARWWLGHDQPLRRAAWWGAFHAVSAYDNAGLALWPDSLARWSGDVWLMLPMAVAVVLGGIGYPVLLELRATRKPGEWSLHTKLTVVTTGVLLLVGPAFMWLTEHGNPATIGHQGLGGELMSGGLAGITARTAGFAPFDYAQAQPATLVGSIMLMFVGGGAASAAGGIKVTTLAVLVLAVVAEVRGDSDINAFGRRISPATARQALAVTMIATMALFAATLALLELAPVRFDQAMVEVTSALSTTGISTGITPGLPAAGHALLVVLMTLGRLGPVAIASSLALRQSRRSFRYPESRPVVG